MIITMQNTPTPANMNNRKNVPLQKSGTNQNKNPDPMPVPSAKQTAQKQPSPKTPQPAPKQQTPKNNPQPTPPANKKRKKKKYFVEWKKVASFFLVVVLLMGGLCGAFLKLHVFADYEQSELTYGDSVDRSTLVSSPFVKNILLIGQDINDIDTDSRSDTMMLISLDSKHMRINMVSFLRDTYCEIPGYYPTKLNAACSFGGPSLLIETLEYNYNIKIDGYVRVGFELLEYIIDAIGGVTIPEIDETESAALYASFKVQMDPGVNVHLNGKQAMMYCRIRKYQSDFYRTERQREVISQIIKGISVEDIIPLLKLSRDLLGKIDCSFNELELTAIAAQAALCMIGGIEQQHIPADGTWWDETINGQAVLQIRWDENREILKDFLY